MQASNPSSSTTYRHFRVAAGNADDPAALELGELTHDRADRADAAATTRVSPAFGWPMFSSPVQAVMPGIPSTPSAVVMGVRWDRACGRLARRRAHAPANRCTLRRCRRPENPDLGRFDSANGATAHHLANLDRRSIRGTGAHPACACKGPATDRTSRRSICPGPGSGRHVSTSRKSDSVGSPCGARRQDDLTIHTIGHQRVLSGRRIAISQQSRRAAASATIGPDCSTAGRGKPSLRSFRGEPVHNHNCRRGG